MKIRLLLFVVGLLPALAWVDDGGAPARFKITTRRKDDAVQVRVEKHRTLFIINSTFGISQAVIVREDEKWPDAVALRLHLKGLSNFRASNGKVTLHAA